MQGISSKALPNAPTNRYKYNGKEEQKEEFSDGSGLEWMDYGARMYDGQIGRFWQIDSECESGGQESWTGYHYCFNSPLNFIDPDGNNPIRVLKAIRTIYRAYRVYQTIRNATDLVKRADGIKQLQSLLIDEALDAVRDVPGLGNVVKTAETILKAIQEEVSKDDTKAKAEETETENTKTEDTEKEQTNSSEKAKPYSKKEAREKAKEKREEQPASEDYVKYKAKELEKNKGKDARRKAHDEKKPGEPDRSKKRINQDY